MSTKKPDLKRSKPLASVIWKELADFSKSDKDVTLSKFSILSLSLPISLMVNLWFFVLSIDTSDGLNVNAGINSVASNIDSSKSLGGSGISADVPSTILKSPTLVKYTLTILDKKNSKSWNDVLFGFGMSITLAPCTVADVPKAVPENILWSKSKELKSPLELVTELKISGWLESSSVPSKFCTVGLKSKQSLNSKIELESFLVLSIFVLVYVGMSSYWTLPANSE